MARRREWCPELTDAVRCDAVPCRVQTGAGSWKTVDAYDVRFKASVGDVVLKAGAANCDQRVAIRNWRTSLEGGGRALHKSKGSAWSDQPWLRMFLRGLRASWSSGGCTDLGAEEGGV